MVTASKHVTPTVTQEALGAVTAQKAAARIETNLATPTYAWLRYCELAAAYGWRSPACRAFVIELAKRGAP